ncbi:MAG: NAD(P)H-binding protein, partial [Rhodoferax sp.]|nr:NAD(P)H-binding protein [Rhodoferax sp.]
MHAHNDNNDDQGLADAGRTGPSPAAPAATALVLGAGGGIGGEMARQLLQAGWRVRALKRALGAPRVWQGGIEWIDGDALVREQVLDAARGCAVIVHAVNPPG